MKKSAPIRSIHFFGLVCSLFFLIGCSGNSSQLINGNQAPELELPDIDGSNIKLSDLQGSIVFIDFWASWCRPCRKQNPKIVALYNKYENARFQDAEGFKIYSVSLDSDKERWLTAIKKDQLKWPDHVSELNGWKSSAVETYHITSIPASVLIDQNGIIIGKDLRHQDLDLILSKRVIP